MYVEHHTWILHWLTAKTSNPHLAEDITSEVFLRAFTKLHLFDGCNAGGWLRTIARNMLIDYGLSARARRELPVDETIERADPDSDPAAIVERVVEREQLA